MLLTTSAVEIKEIAPSPDGQQIAFETGPVSHRLENPADSELFLVAAKGGDARQLTHNQGLEGDIRWMPSGSNLIFLCTRTADQLKVRTRMCRAEFIPSTLQPESSSA